MRKLDCLSFSCSSLLACSKIHTKTIQRFVQDTQKMPLTRPVRPAEEIYNVKRFRPKAFPSWADESDQCAQDDKERCSCVAFPAEVACSPGNSWIPEQQA